MKLQRKAGPELAKPEGRLERAPTTSNPVAEGIPYESVSDASYLDELLAYQAHAQQDFPLTNAGVAPIHQPGLAAGAVLNQYAAHPLHPHMARLAADRAQLSMLGLPVSAEGVPMHIVDMPGHGEGVTRAAAGGAGLGVGAATRLYDVQALTDGGSGDAIAPHTQVHGGQSLFEVGQALVYAQAKAERSRADVLHLLASEKIGSGRRGTEIVNQSFGVPVATTVMSAISTVIASDPQSRLFGDLSRALGRPLDRMALSNERHPGHRIEVHNVARLVYEGFLLASQESPAAETRSAARTALEQAVQRSRDAGLFTVVAAGNDFDKASSLGLPPDASVSDSVGVDGLLSVGAVETGDPRTRVDDRMASFSSVGAEVSAPGMRIPVADNEWSPMARDTDGTSFAAPYVAGLAALMIKANPMLTPDDLDAILLDPANSTDLPGHRDGKGRIDPVRAVAAARAYRR